MIDTINQKESITLGVSNEGERNFPINVVKKWSPQNINYFGDTVYFKVNKQFFSIKVEDFNQIFNN